MGYFTLVLREFSSRVAADDKVWNVPWIGISRDVYSRAAFLTSIVFVPGTISYLAVRGVLGNPAFYARAAYGLGMAATIAVTWLSVLSWRKILCRGPR
jgi:hypothetical protein